MTTVPPDVETPRAALMSRSWVAAALSLITGLGHLYVGRRRAAIVIALGDMLFGIGMATAMMRLPGAPFNVIVPVAMIVGFRVWVIVDAWRSCSPRVPKDSWGSARGRWMAVAGFVIAYLVVSEVPTRLMRSRYGQAFRIPSGSMQPSILVGDYLMAAPVAGPVRERDVIVVYRRDDDQFVHRLVGLPGDTLQMTGGVLARNGRRIAEPYVLPTATSTAPEGTRTWGPLVVPADSVFVLGDNRDESFDSRYRGYVAMADVVRRPTRVYWSRDAEAGRVRWERMGRDIVELEAARQP